MYIGMWLSSKKDKSFFLDIVRNAFMQPMGKVHKKSKKKLTSVSFMYVCVAENAELLVFFYFFFAPSP